MSVYIDIYIHAFRILIEMLSVSTNQHKVSCAEPLCLEVGHFDPIPPTLYHLLNPFPNIKF